MKLSKPGTMAPCRAIHQKWSWANVALKTSAWWRRSSCNLWNIDRTRHTERWDLLESSSKWSHGSTIKSVKTSMEKFWQNSTYLSVLERAPSEFISRPSIRPTVTKVCTKYLVVWTITWWAELRFDEIPSIVWCHWLHIPSCVLGSPLIWYGMVWYGTHLTFSCYTMCTTLKYLYVTINTIYMFYYNNYINLFHYLLHVVHTVVHMYTQWCTCTHSGAHVYIVLTEQNDDMESISGEVFRVQNIVTPSGTLITTERLALY